MDSLRSYNNEDIILELPGDKTVFNVDWLSVFDVKTNSNYGSVIIPNGLNVPPSLIKVRKQTQSLPNCVQLHKRYQIAWEIFGPQITIQLSGQVGMYTNRFCINKYIHIDSQLSLKNWGLKEITHFCTFRFFQTKMNTWHLVYPVPRPPAEWKVQMWLSHIWMIHEDTLRITILRQRRQWVKLYLIY